MQPGLSPSWIDSHCHLQDVTGLDAALARAAAAGVASFICIGTSADSSQEAIDIARSVSSGAVFASVGLHPHEASVGTEAITALLQTELLGESPQTRRIVAIGECGLDYHYEYSPRAAQQESFVEQIALAKLHDLTLVVHSREAWDDTFAILSAEGPPDRTVIHCFTGGPSEARRCLDLGAYLSFSGIVTFKNASDVREALSLCPLDRLLVETDAPYLAPVPHRGQPNEPAFVVIVGEAVAERRSIAVAELASTTSNNTISAFRLAR